MICGNVHRFAAVPTLLLAALFDIGLVASTPFPALAQGSVTWTNTGSMNTARMAHTATLLASGEVLVVGGNDANGLLTSAELYDPSTGQWKTTGSMTTPRAFAGATLLENGEVLVVGGINSDGLSNTRNLLNFSAVAALCWGFLTRLV